MASQLSTLTLLLVLLAPMAAEAQMFRCVDKAGKKHYQSTIPPECIGLPIEQLNNQGTVIRRIDPEGDEKAREPKEAEAAKKRVEDSAAREESRRNRALLDAYTSERDIDEARARALAENNKAVKDVEGRIAGIKKRQAELQKDMEFY